MPIKGASIPEGATLTPSGGTATTYSTIPSSGSGVLTANLAIADYSLRQNTLHTAKNPVLGSNGLYGKGKMTAVNRRPVKDAEANLFLPLARIEVEWHPAQTAQQVADLWNWIALIATDADYANFRASGSLD